ncbi:MAG: Molybdenum cofactor sulfurtransferase [Bacteroidota bacterium]
MSTTRTETLQGAGVQPELAHDEYFRRLRETEYTRLDAQGQVYLDYTGGNLYAASQLERHLTQLAGGVFGNPHSTNPTSQRSTRLVQEARDAVLKFFRAEADYDCIFTQNASGALKIVGESYPFQSEGRFLLFSDNHNSVNGIREYCVRRGGSFEYVPMNYEDLTVSEPALREKLARPGGANKLFAFPAQSNVSGVKHSLDWIPQAQEQGWDVLLDAAAFVPSSRLDLSRHRPDFVSVSFYKIFGYPTGLGCLLVRRAAFDKLEKPWFAGGTVTLASVLAPYHFLADNYERFEDGTIDYLNIPALGIGLSFMETVGMERLQERVQSLSLYLYHRLRDLRHDNGEPQVDIFGPAERRDAGGTMIMAFRNPDGTKIRFERIESLANERKISIRSGCFCNPGLDETNNCLTAAELTQYFSSRSAGNYWDMIRFINKMRGATRVSVGIATTRGDLDAFLDFVGSLRNKTFAPEGGAIAG